MAVQVTDEYQIVASGNTDYGEIRLYARYVSQSQENNTTTYQLKSTYYLPNNNISFDWGWNFLGTPNTDRNSEKNYGSTTFNRGETTIQEKTWTISHNIDGTSPEVHIETNWASSFGGGRLVTENITFPNISRYAIIQSATNFTDEENPIVTFTNTGQYNVRAILYAVVNDQRVEIGISPSLSNGETSYTFDLDEYAYGSQSQTQRDKLRELCTGQSIPIIIAVQTYASPTYTSTTRVTMSIVNANPTFTYTITETNANVMSVLGGSSASSIIQNASIVDITFTPVALKHATISAVNVVYNGLTYTATTSPYTISIPIVNSNVFTLSVIDSRGYVTSQVDSNRTLIDYEAVKTNTFSFKREAPTSSNIIFNGEFTYWSSFGNISNTPVVKWKLDDGSYNTIPSSNYSIDATNHKLTITNYTLSNALVYTSSGQFTIYIEDKLTSDFVTSDSGKVNRGIPTFEAGEHDLQVNGDLYIADTDRNNKVNVLSAIASATSIEESGNGYIKFKDGTMICWGSKEGSIGVTTRWDAFYYSDNIDFSNFAKSFIATPKVSISANSVSAGYLYLVATSPSTNKQPSTTSAGGFCIIRPSSSGSVGYSVSYIAIGRWKN